MWHRQGTGGGQVRQSDITTGVSSYWLRDSPPFKLFEEDVEALLGIDVGDLRMEGQVGH